MDEFFSSHTIWVYIVTGEIALFFTIFLVTLNEKRWPTFYDLYKFFVWSLFVALVTGYIDNNPGYSIVIGLAPELVYKLLLQMLPDLMPTLLSAFSNRQKKE